MKADVFIKYKIVFADYDKRNHSEMEVCFVFVFRKKKKHNSHLIYLQSHYVFKMF